MWKYSRLDSILVFINVFELVLKIGWAFVAWQMPLWANALVVLLLGILYFYNYIVVNHEFMHTPFFKQRWLNDAYKVFSSANLLYPMTVIDESHKLHHDHNNDPLEDGECQDPTSTFRFGKNGRPESPLTYCFFNVFRAHFPMELRMTWQSLMAMKDKRRRWVVLGELLGAIAVYTVIAFIDWRWLLFGVMPAFYFGWFWTDMQNYYEHYRATNPKSNYANSVSYYGKLGNLLMFNEGYHQEHHIAPGTHWTKRKQVREKFRDKMTEAGLYISPVPLVFGFLDRSPHPVFDRD